MNIIMLDDCGDTSTITDWVEANDGLNPIDETSIVKEGSHSAKLGIDASLSETDNAYWTNTQAQGDLTQYQHDWLYLWVYFTILDYLNATGNCVILQWGSDVDNRAYVGMPKTDLSVGWNLLKFDLDDPDWSTGTIDWSAISFLRFTINEITDNTTDFSVYLDSLMFVRDPNVTVAYDLGIAMSETVTLNPEWDYSKGEKQVRTETRAKSGRFRVYKWYDYEKISFQNNWVTASDMALVNSWWDTNTKLLFFVTSDFVTEVHSVMIMNEETPLAMCNKPYSDHFKGKIELEGY